MLPIILAEAAVPKDPNIFMEVVLSINLLLMIAIAAKSFIGKPKAQPLEMPVEVKGVPVYALATDLAKLEERQKADTVELRKEIQDAVKHFNDSGERRHEKLVALLTAEFSCMRTKMDTDAATMHDKINKSAETIAGLQAEISNQREGIRNLKREVFFNKP
ncbi:MAG: hypothetical protein LBV12_06445 [Puniceicoccales bacterium]|jgi:hypothetical protein|nr:hypothetical protein [Puniceicoccales bacterium]